MSLERVDPFEQEDRFAVDHLLRYAWIQPLADQKRVLDIACGGGFGSVMLAHANASAVVGVDADTDTIQRNRDEWKADNLTFHAGRIEELDAFAAEPFDLISCFETLEHVKDPDAALASLKGVLKEGGTLVGSVPGESDWQEHNPYHLHRFDAARLRQLLEHHFANVRLHRQNFRIESAIDGEDSDPRIISKQTTDRLRIRTSAESAAVDTYVFIACDGELPDLSACRSAVSRAAWLTNESAARTAFAEVKRVHAELKQVYQRYHRLFAEHGDLQRKFTNVLGWGQYHYKVVHGEQPATSYTDKIAAATSRREEELRQTVEQLQHELAAVRAERDQLLANARQAEAALAATAQKRRDRFTAQA